MTSKKIFRPTSNKRILFFIISDFFLVSIALYLSFLLRFSLTLSPRYEIVFFKTFLLFCIFRIILFYLFGLYKFQWRYFGFKDQVKLLYVTFLSTLGFYLFAILFRDIYFIDFPRSVLAIEFFISIFLLITLRISKRIYLSVFKKSALAKATLIVGSNNKSEQLIRNLMLSNEYRPVVIIDSNKDLKNTYIHGIKVITFDCLKNSVFDEIETAIITDDENKVELVKIYKELEKYDIKDIKILNSFFDDSNVKVRDITVEDLLARHPNDLDKGKISDFVKEKTVLITGAGGSIGSEISRQCKKFGAKQLILLDHSEYNLYQICEELDDNNIIPVMQTVRNFGFIENTFKKYKPDIVIHAAAYKHVPLVEGNILEGISNNIIGTKNCIDLSIKYGVEKFVLISTDKAVRPTNVMGTTKRICELYAQNVDSKQTEIVAVRFGNVLGSSGSVIPKFKSQIEEGKNITVTHPDITRYFMLIPEACELVLQAGAIAQGGEIFILDMGEPIKIVDLAKKMIELSGKEDIEIEFCGLRPGEKLYEELLINDSDKKTDYESITVASPTKFDIEELNKLIDDLLVVDNKIAALKKIVPEFEHKLNS